MNTTRVAPAVLLCLVLISVIYGFSVAFSASVNTKDFETDDSAHALAFSNGFTSVQKSKSPTGDAIDDPRPN